jgi:hypothetical protein
VLEALFERLVQRLLELASEEPSEQAGERLLGLHGRPAVARLRCHSCIALIDIVRPRQLIIRGGSTCSSVETIVPGPAFQRNSEPGATGPSNDIDFTSRFHCGHSSKCVRTSQTASGGAAISISRLLLTGACGVSTTRS